MNHIYPNREHLEPLKNAMHEAWPASSRNGYPCVPAAHTEAIAEYLSDVVAELIESYLDAGSEREAIVEEVLPHLINAVKGWTEED